MTDPREVKGNRYWATLLGWIVPFEVVALLVLDAGWVTRIYVGWRVLEAPDEIIGMAVANALVVIGIGITWGNWRANSRQAGAFCSTCGERR